MEYISSVSNPKIKEIVKLQQKKYRNETGLFLLEGLKPIYEAFVSKIEFECVFVTSENQAKYEFLKEKIVVVSEQVLKKISTTDSNPEAVAVAKQKKYSTTELANKKRVLLIENVKDAGNLGTLIRSACAFSIDSIVLCGDTVDVYNPKVVRSTVGALFKLPILKMTLEQVKSVLENSKFIASVVNYDDVINPKQIDYNSPFVLMLGSESKGLSKEAIDIAQIKTTIPISNKTESLNLSTAGSILLYLSANDFNKC